jgi:hypothetical protein
MNIILSTHERWARYLIGAQVDGRGATQLLDRCGQAVVRSSCLSQVLGRCARLLLAASFYVRRRYLIAVPRPVPAAPLAVRRTYLIVVLRPVLRLLPTVASTWSCCSGRYPNRCLRRRDAVAAGVEYSADEAPVACHRHLVVVPRPLPAAPLAVRRRFFIVVLDDADACFSRQAHC